MTDPSMIVTAASVGLVGFGIISAASLRAWNSWLELKRLELSGSPHGRSAATAAKPDIAELKERVRKLEAIASGMEI